MQGTIQRMVLLWQARLIGPRAVRPSNTVSARLYTLVMRIDMLRYRYAGSTWRLLHQLCMTRKVEYSLSLSFVTNSANWLQRTLILTVIVTIFAKQSC